MSRKLYPYVTKKQLQIAPNMGEFVKSNKKELTRQGNQVLSGPGEMTRNQAKPPLRKAWSNTQRKGTGARKVSGYIDRNGGSRGRAKKILTGAHAVKFGADPKSR